MKRTQRATPGEPEENDDMDNKPPPPTRASTTASARSPDPPLAAAIRQRFPQRQTSNQNLNGSLSPPPRPNRRRSSLLSYSSLDEVAQTLTNDFINPSTNNARNSTDEDEVTHWHSTPLAFALLPAIGGLLFKNGSAFMTDILLLGLAAIFMNWSIRLPWDWYYSAQMQRRRVDLDDLPILDDVDGEIAIETSSADASPKQEAQVDDDKAVREDAAAELRRQEKLALFSTFLFPVLAAYLIHIIRGQLSTSSTGLVSDFNLSIFLLAAEIRPCRQLVRLITNRTLHLQRTVTGLDDPFGAAIQEKSTLNTLTSRVAELEARLADHTIMPPNVSIAQKQDVSELSLELRKRYEPRIEGLERAMRRYEKRSTTLAMLTEQRLAQLDGALQDTLSLAAQAARQSQDRGPVAKVLERVTAIFVWPTKVGWGLVMWPWYVVDEVYRQIMGVLFGSGPGKGQRRSSSRSAGQTRDEKGKAAGRRPVR